MFSIKVSVSGERGHTIENYPDHTGFWTPSKAGEEVRVSLSSLGTVKMVLPRSARIERLATGEGDSRSEYLVLVIPAQAALTVQSFRDEGDESWPHVEVDVRKKQPDTFYPRLEETGLVFEVASLFSDTE